jgi:hypothetical protein
MYGQDILMIEKKMGNMTSSKLFSIFGMKEYKNVTCYLPNAQEKKETGHDGKSCEGKVGKETVIVIYRRPIKSGEGVSCTIHEVITAKNAASELEKICITPDMAEKTFVSKAGDGGVERYPVATQREKYNNLVDRQKRIIEAIDDMR